MAKVYGVSDSEISFITFLNSHLKVIKIDSFEDYQNYHDNYREEKKIKEEDYDNQFRKNQETLSRCNNQIKQDEYDLRGVEWDIKKKKSIIGKYWGKIKEDIQSEINQLENKSRKLRNNISDSKNTIVETKTENDSLIIERKNYLLNFDKDVHKLFELERNEEFKKKRQGAVGENKLIGFISNGFEKDNNSYLINGINFDIRGGAININDSTKLETQIDHIFVCSKGIFFIETKHWKVECTNDFKHKLIEQLEKIKRTISFIFKDKIDLEVIKVLLVGTEKKINLDGSDFISLRIDEIREFLLNQKDVLSNDEIKLTMNELSKYLPKEKFGDFPKFTLMMNSWFIKVKNKITRQKSNHVNV